MNRNRNTILSRLLVAALAGLVPTVAQADPPIQSFLAGAPEGFIPPPLHPGDARLVTRPLGEGVYALLSGDVAVDNNGFVVGENGVLVIDAHINAEMAGQIQDAVRRVTDKPILYLVNTNYHGDHTFGNYAFPEATRVVAQRRTVLAPRVEDEARPRLDRARQPVLTQQAPDGGRVGGAGVQRIQVHVVQGQRDPVVASLLEEREGVLQPVRLHAVRVVGEAQAHW